MATIVSATAAFFFFAGNLASAHLPISATAAFTYLFRLAATNTLLLDFMSTAAALLIELFFTTRLCISTG